MIDARTHLASLVGQEIRTLTGQRPNLILRLEDEDVIVGTMKSPDGRPVPIQWIQDAIDMLLRDGEITIDVQTVGYRGAFIGTVLATLPRAQVQSTRPRRIILPLGDQR